jgi:hypothetical protein
VLLSVVHEIPRPIRILLLVLGFVWWWPIGLAILAYLIGSRQLGRRGCAPGRWYNTAADGPGQPGSPWGSPGANQDSGPSAWGQALWGNAGRGGFWGQRPAAPPPSGNRAFDEYRAETLRRLEEEQKEFVEYLERLRRAKDKSEFDQFMAERRNTPRPPVPSEQG